jgi:hypothetical protein
MKHPYMVTAKDGTLRVKEGNSRPPESGLLGFKEISKMNVARIKRKESSFPNRRLQERRKVGHPD